MMMKKTNKEKALDFLRLIIDGKTERAYAQYVDMAGRHHSLFAQAGMPALRKAMAENHTQFPQKSFVIRNVIAEEALLAVHSKLTLETNKEFAVVYIFRFENGKIVELWDCGQPIRSDSPNADGAF
jgi:predicted SnoaL-like aldol condensation-catalyzing enzyme